MMHRAKIVLINLTISLSCDYPQEGIWNHEKNEMHEKSETYRSSLIHQPGDGHDCSNSFFFRVFREFRGRYIPFYELSVIQRIMPVTKLIFIFEADGSFPGENL